VRDVRQRRAIAQRCRQRSCGTWRPARRRSRCAGADRRSVTHRRADGLSSGAGRLSSSSPPGERCHLARRRARSTAGRVGRRPAHLRLVGGKTASHQVAKRGTFAFRGRGGRIARMRGAGGWEVRRHPRRHLEGFRSRRPLVRAIERTALAKRVACIQRAGRTG